MGRQVAARCWILAVLVAILAGAKAYTWKNSKGNGKGDKNNKGAKEFPSYNDMKIVDEGGPEVETTGIGIPNMI